MNLAKVGKISAGVLLLAIAAGYGALSSIDVEAYRDDIIQAAEDATGRKVKISGPIKLKVSLTPSVVLDDVHLSNAPWAKAPEMVSIGHVEADIGLLSALFGTIAVNRLVVHDANIQLERRKNGTANWQLSPKEAKGSQKEKQEAEQQDQSSDADGDGLSIAVQSIDIKNLKLALNDAVSGQKLSINIKGLGAKAASPSDPVKLSLDMVYNGLPIQAKGKVGPIENLMANKESIIDLTSEVPGIKFAAKGNIGSPMSGKDVDLTIDLDASSYSDLGKAIGADLSAVPPLAFNGKVETFGDAGYRIHDGVLSLSDQKIQLMASADMSKFVTSVKADIKAGKLNLQKLLDGLSQKTDAQSSGATSKAQTASTKSSNKVFPSDPLPVAALRTVNADAKVAVETLTLPGGLTLNDAKLSAVLKNGTLNVSPNFGVGKGHVSGAIHLVTPKKKGASALSIKLRSKNLSLGDVARDMGYTDMISGAGTAINVDLTGNGASVRSLMAGLNGKIYVDTQKGEIINDKLSKAIGSWAMSGLTMIDPTFAAREKTVLSCMVVNVPIKDGMMGIDNSIAAETDVLNLIVNGGVNLKTEGLDLGFDTVPHGVGTGVAQAATGLVHMGGTLANPSVGVDLKGAGKAALKVGAAIATGGLSLIGDAVLNEATKDPHPCLTAKGQVSKKKTSGSSKSSGTSSSGKTSDNPVDAIGGAVKGLFGN